jgi:sortase A
VTGHQIVPPTQVSVLLPVPDEPDAKPTVAMLTMTSCHPEFSARERYVVHAELDASYPRDKGVPADILKVGE